MALYWIISSLFISLLYWQAQNWTQRSRGSLSCAERSEGVTTLHLLPILCLMQPRMLLAFFAARAHYSLMFHLMSSSTPRSSSTRLLSSWVEPSTCCCLGLFLSTCRTQHLLSLDILKFLSARFSSLSRSPWTAARLSGISAILPV